MYIPKLLIKTLMHRVGFIIFVDVIVQPLWEADVSEHCVVVCSHQLVQMICVNPPFTAKDNSSSLNSVQLVDCIWKLMKFVCINSHFIVCILYFSNLIHVKHNWSSRKFYLCFRLSFLLRDVN